MKPEYKYAVSIIEHLIEFMDDEALMEITRIIIERRIKLAKLSINPPPWLVQKDYNAFIGRP